MIRPVIVRSDPDHYCAEIPIRSSQIFQVKETLRIVGIYEVGIGGGPGWIIDEGVLSIAGTQTAVEYALDTILYKLNGPKFESGLEVAKRYKQGALP